GTEMSYSAEIIRKACLQLEDCKLDSIPEKQISSYSNRLRESCRRYSEKKSTKSVQNEVNISNAKRHKKFVLAKLELKRLQEHSKDKKTIPILKKTVNMSDKHNKSVKFSPEPLFWDCALDGDLDSLKKISLNVCFVFNIWLTWVVMSI
ncbi:hypothetical protein MXB_4480, partial [Myxobolus squamalis]